jgi:hypothetical protein
MADCSRLRTTWPASTRCCSMTGNWKAAAICPKRPFGNSPAGKPRRPARRATGRLLGRQKHLRPRRGLRDEHRSRHPTRAHSRLARPAPPLPRRRPASPRSLCKSGPRSALNPGPPPDPPRVITPVVADSQWALGGKGLLPGHGEKAGYQSPNPRLFANRQPLPTDHFSLRPESLLTLRTTPSYTANPDKSRGGVPRGSYITRTV